MKNLATAFLLIVMALTSCVYNNEDELYPEPGSSQPTGSGQTGQESAQCDTTNVSYQSTVVPLLSTHRCLDCHSGGTPSGNVGLDSYGEVKAEADNGRLYGVIAHLPGFSRMPRGGNRMPECDIRQIKGWIDQGALNN